MPQIFKIGSYIVYFWSNEGNPLEPIHVHIALGTPTANATKVWITKGGGVLLCNNNSQIPSKTLRDILEVLETQSFVVIRQWQIRFGEIRYYC